MEALNDTVVDVGGSLRQERQMFDFSCFREAWLNACLHNRWSRQTPPAVYMFDDRIEIISMGGLPDGLTLDEFYEGKSKPVNLELQQIMVQLDYITENFITVTIPLNKAVKKNLQKTKEYVLNECDKKILNLIKENSYITVHELSGRIGIGMTTVMKHIRVLKEKGVVERRGSKKKGQWIVREEIL